MRNAIPWVIVIIIALINAAAVVWTVHLAEENDCFVPPSRPVVSVDKRCL